MKITKEEYGGIWSYIQDALRFRFPNYTGKDVVIIHNEKTMREIIADTFKRASEETVPMPIELVQEFKPYWDKLKTHIKRHKARENRKERESVMRDCGLSKGKDSMGRVIWD